MTYFPDLSQYSYLPPGRELLSVGWLDADHLYPTGPVEDRLADALLKLIASPSHQTPGVHECDLCGEDDLVIDNPYAVDGQSRLGTAEIHVEGPDGVHYAAPTVIHHYVVEHGYAPPQAFQLAVLAAV